MTLGIDPAAQGRGLGGRLIAPVLARADAEGRAVYLETFDERNLRFYGARGFEVAERFRTDGGRGPDAWALLRRPRADSEAKTSPAR